MSAALIAFHITDRCQLDCQHCLRDPELTPKDLPLSLMVKVMSEAKSIYRSAQVALTGGEPTLHPQFAGGGVPYYRIRPSVHNRVHRPIPRRAQPHLLQPPM